MYSCQKLGIYIYIFILSVYIKQRGAVTMTTPWHHRLSQWHGVTSDHIPSHRQPPSAVYTAADNEGRLNIKLLSNVYKWNFYLERPFVYWGRSHRTKVDLKLCRPMALIHHGHALFLNKIFTCSQRPSMQSVSKRNTNSWSRSSCMPSHLRSS